MYAVFCSFRDVWRSQVNARLQNMDVIDDMIHFVEKSGTPPHVVEKLKAMIDKSVDQGTVMDADESPQSPRSSIRGYFSKMLNFES